MQEENMLDDLNPEEVMPYHRLIPEENIENIQDDVKSLLHNMSEPVMLHNSLTPGWHRRLQGLGTRLYGFINALFDLSGHQKGYYPPNIDYDTMKKMMEQVENLRNIEEQLATAQRLVKDNLLVSSNIVYQTALAYYNNVRIAARNGVPGANVLFGELSGFFKNYGPKREGKPPTQKQVMRDARGLLKGSRTGKIVLENYPDTIVRGKHEVIVETDKG